MGTESLKQKIATFLVGIPIGLTALVGCDAINLPRNIDKAYPPGTIKARDVNGKPVEYTVLVTDYSRKPGYQPEMRVVTAEAVDKSTVPHKIYGSDNRNSYKTNKDAHKYHEYRFDKTR